MNLKIGTALAVLSVVAVCAAPTAHAAAKFSLVGDLNYGLNSFEGTSGGLATKISGALGFGGGILVGFGQGNVGVETGALYLTHKYSYSIAGVSVAGLSISSSSVSVPLMVRFGKTVSFGVGGYADIGLDSGSEVSYGVIAGPRLSFGSGLFIDGRFAYGLKSYSDLADSSKTYNPMEAQLLVGFTFGKNK